MTMRRAVLRLIRLGLTTFTISCSSSDRTTASANVEFCSILPTMIGRCWNNDASVSPCQTSKNLRPDYCSVYSTTIADSTITATALNSCQNNLPSNCTTADMASLNECATCLEASSCDAFMAFFSLHGSYLLSAPTDPTCGTICSGLNKLSAACTSAVQDYLTNWEEAVLTPACNSVGGHSDCGGACCTLNVSCMFGCNCLDMNGLTTVCKALVTYSSNTVTCSHGICTGEDVFCLNACTAACSNTYGLYALSSLSCN
jgi:hypothetical protein